MLSNRLELLKQFLEEDPNDPFNHYALATEYLKTEPSKAKEIYEYLLKNHAEYLPTYYHAGALLVEFEEYDSAQKVYLEGIELAKKTGNERALKELKGAYQMLLDELEM